MRYSCYDYGLPEGGHNDVWLLERITLEGGIALRVYIELSNVRSPFPIDRC